MLRYPIRFVSWQQKSGPWCFYHWQTSFQLLICLLFRKPHMITHIITYEQSDVFHIWCREILLFFHPNSFLNREWAHLMLSSAHNHPQHTTLFNQNQILIYLVVHYEFQLELSSPTKKKKKNYTSPLFLLLNIPYNPELWALKETCSFLKAKWHANFREQHTLHTYYTTIDCFWSIPLQKKKKKLSIIFVHA